MASDTPADSSALLFSQNAKEIAQRTGLKIKYMRTEGMYRRVDTMAYIILCLKYNRPDVYSRLRKTRLLNWDLYLNLGDIVSVVAEKV